MSFAIKLIINGNQLVRKLIGELSKLKDLTVAQSSISRMGKGFWLDGKAKGFIYVKAIASPRHYWGITKNTVDKIGSQRHPWRVILLLRIKEYRICNFGFRVS